LFLKELDTQLTGIEYLSTYSAIFTHIITAQNNQTITYSTKILSVKVKQAYIKYIVFRPWGIRLSETFIHVEHSRPELPQRLTPELW